MPRGTSGPGLSPRGGRHCGGRAPPPPPSLPGRWGWSAALDSGTCSGRCSPCRCTRPCGGRRRTGSTCRPLKVSRAQRSQITHRSRARGRAGNANRPAQRAELKELLGVLGVQGLGRSHMYGQSPQTSGRIPDPRLPGAHRMSCGWEARVASRKECGVCLLGTPPRLPESERAALSPRGHKGQAVTEGPDWAPAQPQACHSENRGCLQMQLAGEGGAPRER